MFSFTHAWVVHDTREKTAEFFRPSTERRAIFCAGNVRRLAGGALDALFMAWWAASFLESQTRWGYGLRISSAPSVEPPSMTISSQCG
jgi:hypothetical protein